MNWCTLVLSKYAEFNSRARRSEYWYFVLINILISIGIYILDAIIGTFGVLGILFSLAILIPGLAVSVRRLHDTGCSSWNLLLAFIPLIGAVILLIFFFQDSTSGENEYGRSPK